MARESVLYSNEHRHGGSPSDSDFNRLYNLFNDSDDTIGEPSLSDIMTPLVYEQFAYGESEFEELSRVWALFGDPSLGTPIPWADVFGMSLAEAARAALVLHGWVVMNGGRLDRGLFDAPHMQEVFERVAPREQLIGLADYFTATVEQARALHSEATGVSKDKQRFAFNPFVARPLIDLGAAGVWAPQTMLVSRAIFPSNLYYVGIRRWGKPFADNLGDRVEQYVGRQLRLLGGDHVKGEIEYAKGQKSVDWFWVTDQAVVLVECKSARMTLGAKAADDSLGAVVARSIGKARAQIDRTAQFIRDRHPAFAHLPSDRPIVGMIVTAEPFYLGNAGILPEYGALGATASQVVSLRELEHFVMLEKDEAAGLLLSIVADPEKRTWALSSVMNDLHALPKNTILEQAWHQYDYIDARGPAVAPASLKTS
ncbi:hypothetical protein GCM10023152_35280 [Agromyces bauzanensis]|uniref:NERD domain-containing protein n=2 Tax=Agromyces bauzanensis TaxID=1308924 RepID=A0A917PAD3_9MICO|nr:hypothetical protein GCM10011372_02880 [Agromyces bauzanensis]